MKLLRVILGLGLCAGLVLPFFARHAAAVDVVTAIIECPAFTSVKLDWQDKIGSHPTFKVSTGTHVAVPSLERMFRQGQTIYCYYRISAKFGRAEDIHSQYQYTVQRAIQVCTQKSPKVMECQVKK